MALPKKISADQFSWYVFLVCGLIIPFVGSVVLNLIFKVLNISIDDGMLSDTFVVILNLIIIWLGVRFYINYAQKKYELSNKTKLVTNTVVTFVAWSILGLILYYFAEKPPIAECIWATLDGLLEVIVFYFALNRYLTIK